MKIVIYRVEPAKYMLEQEEVIQKLVTQKTYYYFDQSIHSNKRIEKPYLQYLSWYKRWLLYVKNWLNYDLIICNGYSYDYFLIPFLLNHVLPGKRTIAIAGDTPFREPRGVKGIIKSAILHYIFRKKYIRSLPGGFYAHVDYFRKFGMSSDRIFVLPFQSLHYQQRRRRLGVREKFTFLYVGQLIERKCIDFALSEFVSLFADNSEVEFVVVGKGDEGLVLKERFSQYKNIVFFGELFDAELADQYMRSDVFVLCSWFEQWGLVVNEALSAGLPVIVNQAVGARYDLIDNRDTGFVYMANKAGELAKYMKVLFEDRDLLEQMSDNAFILMRDHWNYQFFSDCFLKFIDASEQNLKKQSKIL